MWKKAKNPRRGRRLSIGLGRAQPSLLSSQLGQPLLSVLYLFTAWWALMLGNSLISPSVAAITKPASESRSSDRLALSQPSPSLPSNAKPLQDVSP
jgi:hypothetical protein